jgi:hypothetical protein
MTSWRYLKDNYIYYDLLAKTLSISDGLHGYQVSGTISRAGAGAFLASQPGAHRPSLHHSSTSHRARTPRGRESLFQKPLRGMTGLFHRRVL